MSGELTQIAATGHQDSWLTEKPEFTFFKGLYKRHTNFAMGQQNINFSGQIGYNRRMEATLDRSGDLVYQTYIVYELEALKHVSARQSINANYVPNASTGIADTHLSFCNDIGHRLTQYVEVNIGSNRFDRQTGNFMYVWEQLSRPVGKELKSTVGHYASYAELDDARQRDQVIYVPLHFWFNRHADKVLPLTALQYHDVKIALQTCPKADVVVLGPTIDPAVTNGAAAYTGGDLVDCYLLVNYVYLDGGERKIFAAQPHEYIIEQVQYSGPEAKTEGKTDYNIALIFNHPVKELIWYIQRQTAIDAKEYFNFSGSADYTSSGSSSITNTEDPLISASLTLNGHERFNHSKGPYFRQIVPLECHTRVPNAFIYGYSFALDPEAWQPSGSCNFSRIDTIQLKLKTQSFAGEIHVFARSINVARFVSGMAGLKYAS